MTAVDSLGYGVMVDEVIEHSKNGGYIVKGTTVNNREGNEFPRRAEVTMGRLNAVGLQKKSVD